MDNDWIEAFWGEGRLADQISGTVKELLAKAWEQGFRAGELYEQRHDDLPTNPYRQENR